MGCTECTTELHGNPEFMRELAGATRTTLAPGPQLDHQNKRAIDVLLESMDEILSPGSTRIQLYEWTKHLISLASTEGIYGSSNPFRERTDEDDFWYVDFTARSEKLLSTVRTWNNGIPALMAKMFTSKPTRARERVVLACKRYISGNIDDAAEMTKERIRILRKYGVPEDDVARMAGSFNIAVLSNTAPTAFWTLYNIFSDSSLLEHLREELEMVAVRLDTVNCKFELDTAAIRTKCPLLLGAFEETQRTRTTHANIRQVMEDTWLDAYRLRKGNYVMIPNAPIHNSSELWGKDAKKFNLHRFVKDGKGFSAASSLPAHAYLAWGTAPHLCPARQFASTEILVFVALLILRADMVPVRNRWNRPALMTGELTVMASPKKDLEVEIRPREGWQGNWSAIIGESKSSKVPLTSG